MSQVNRVSKAGLDLIKGFEGLRRRSEPLPKGGWIVGYGHTRSAREGVEVSLMEAEYLLRYDLQDIEQFVAMHVHAPLNQNEFDALASLCWNIGKDAFANSDVLNYVNAGEMLAAAESFSAWRKARIGGRLIVVDALVRRRTAEKNLFLSHPSGPPAAPSLVVRPELDVAASVMALSEGALSIEAKMHAAEKKEQATALPNIIANDQFSGEDKVENIVIDVDDAEELDDITPNNEFDKLADLVIDKDPSLNVDVDLDDIEDESEDKVLPPFPVDGDISDETDSVDDASEDGIEDETVGTVWEETDLDDIEDDTEEPVYDLDSADAEDDDDDSDVDLALDDASLDDIEDDETGDEDTLSRAMAAAALVEAEEKALVDEIRNGEPESVEEAVSETVEETVEDVDVKPDEELAVEDKVIIDDDVEGDVAEDEVLPEVYNSDDVDEDAVDAIEEVDDEPTGLELASDMADDSDDVSAEEQTPWNGGPVEEEAEPVSVFDTADEYAEGDERRIVLNDIDYPNGMTEEEMEAFDPTAFPNGRKERNGFLVILPFLLLAIIGLVMMGLGLYDWWGLLQSNQPINENELYAGPFLTLIGGFGLVFGLYFTVRKMLVKGH